MNLTAKQIEEKRKKYNVGSIQEEKPSNEQIANERIKRLKAGTYAQETTPVTDKLINNQQENVVTPVGQPEKKGLLQKTSELSEKTFGKASDLLFGTTGKTVGTVLTQGLASGASLAGKETVLGADVKKLREQEQKITPTDIAFTTLELLPGGGMLGKALKKLPGGKLIAEGINNTIGKLAKSQKEKAVKLFTEALAPTTKVTKKEAEKVVPGLIDKGVKGSLQKIETRATKELTETGAKIDEIIEALPEGSKIKVKPVVDSITDWQQGYIVQGKVINDKAVKLGDDLKQVFTQFGDIVDTKNMRQIRQILDEEIAMGKGFTADVITKIDTKVKYEATKAIREELAKEVPGLDALNKEYTFWKSVEDVVGATLERTKGQSGRLREGAGALLGGISGAKGGVETALIGAAIGKIMTKVINSPTWKTTSAGVRNEIADALVSGNRERLFNVIRMSGILTKNELDNLTE